MEDIDLELDEMELVAAAAGYYYYSCLTKQPSRCLSPRRCEFVSEVLNGHDDYCREMLRMDKHVFHKLCDILRQRAMLRDTAESRFRNKKGILSQNVLAACTFDLQFIFIYPGWEGSVTDSHVLRAVLDNPDQNFPQIPEGKYYLVDSGYLNTGGFIAPFEGVRYQQYEFRGANQLPRNAKELFNHRHCFLRNAILRSFNVLKARFPILKLAPQYSFQIQRDIVIAGCVLHNFIRREERNEWLFDSVGAAPVDEPSDPDDLPDVQFLSSMQEQFAYSLRDSIAAAMWDDFLNKWDEW
ncbi:uncharacterized protein LOC107489716 [Arachis duranensis]|uniref:Uncharacterized protein LOC107489716 n=1 Tax=Arachis duranensis TaxID=130453 RepID=A0A6P5NTH7_ARADU|nr:uncharacterized protein LOC107489716 [Arachis duranensis]